MNWIRFSKFIFRLYIPVFWHASLATFIGCLTILSGMGLIGTSAYLICYAALQPSIAELQVAIIGVRFFGLSRSIFRYLERINSHSVNLKMVSKLRLWFYERIEPLVPAKTGLMTTGDLLTRAIHDIETLDQFFVRVITPPLIAIVVVITTAFFLYTIHGLLGWTALIVLAGGGIFLLLVSLVVHQKHLDKIAFHRGNLFSYLSSIVGGISDLSINGDPVSFNIRLQNVQGKYSRIQKKSVYGNAFLNALLPLFSGLGMIILLVVASNLAQDKQVAPKLVGVAALIMISAYEAFQPFPQTGSFLAQSKQSVARLLEIVDQIPDIIPPENPVNIKHFRSLEFEHVTFRYSGTTPQVFSDLTFKVKAGDRIALVGPSGSGKTTLMNLLLRFWEYSSGSVRINGTELREFSIADLHNLIRTSSQKPYFFPISLRENLNLVRPEIKVTEIESALAQVESLDWVTGLPSGLDTILGERGMKISEGQRKRLDLARTILSDAPLIILDEPFAGIDQIMERTLTESLLGGTRDKTLLIITHHLTSLQNYDSIFYLYDGRIIEQGTHNQLMQLDNEYARMFRMQKNIM